MKKELIDKLNKKDKEDFLKRRQKMYIKPMYLWVIYIKWITLFFLFTLINLSLWYIAFSKTNPDVIISISLVFFHILRILVYAIIIGVLLDYIIFLINLFKLAKLKNEYFETVPKIR